MTSVIDLPICVLGINTLQRCFVIDAITSSILGMDALTGMGMRINFATGEIFTEGKKETIVLTPGLGVAPLCQALKQTEIIQIDDYMKREGCTDEEVTLALELFRRWESVWKDPMPGKCTLSTHHIDTGCAQLIAHRLRHLSLDKMHELTLQVNKLLEAEAIQPSTTPWSSPIVLVLKKNGEMRLCIDYHTSNSVTIKDKYLLPRITELHDRLGTATIFSTFDLVVGFHQVLLDEESRQKTAFITLKRLYEYRVLAYSRGSWTWRSRVSSHILMKLESICTILSLSL